jgi:hypothetical protein
VTVGACVGVRVGDAVGANDGEAVGCTVGAMDGASVGGVVGMSAGDFVGAMDGASVGGVVGMSVEDFVGYLVGPCVGAAVGAVGDDVGDLVGISRFFVTVEILLVHSAKPVVESNTYTSTRGSVSCHRSAQAIEDSDWLTSTVAVITRSVSARPTSKLSEMVSTLVPLAFLALRTRRRTP